jgi:hypothetical protein
MGFKSKLMHEPDSLHLIFTKGVDYVEATIDNEEMQDMRNIHKDNLSKMYIDKIEKENEDLYNSYLTNLQEKLN